MPDTPAPGARYEIPKEGSLGLLALGAAGLRAWRAVRDGTPQPPEPAPAPPPPAEGRKARRVLLVGWDAADWRVIRPLLDAGLMPTLKGLLDRGVSGNLATLDPPLSPMLWTSIATGKTADRHGILGFTEPTPDGQGLRPVLGTSRKVKAFWNIATQEGLRSHVVGWWPSHPAEPIRGAMVSNFYHRATAAWGEAWPLVPGAVHPPELADTLAELRVHPGELTAAHVLPFVPRAADVDQDKDRRLASLAKIIADAASVHAAATYLMEHEPWDLAAVYYDAIDHFGHGFMKYHPPRRAGVSEELYELYKDVTTAGYRFHDMMLDRLLQLAGPETTVVLCSDHGFHPDHLRPDRIPREPAGPAAEHREYGILAMAGPGVRTEGRVYGATLLDVAPTVLTLLGLPVGEDMQGRALLQALDDATPPAAVPSWEDVEGEAGMHAAEARRDPWAEQQAMQQLVELGYVEPPGEDAAKAIERHHRESRFYLARVHLHQSDHAAAAAILEALFAEAPEELRYGLRLADSYLALGRVPDARRVADRVVDEYERQREDLLARRREARAKAAEARRQAEADGGAAPMPPVPATDDDLLRPLPGLDLMQGTILLAEDRLDEAMEHLRRAEAADPRLPYLHLRIGDVYLKQERWDDAERAFLKALTIDPDSAPAHHGLAIAHLRRDAWEPAAEAALRAVGLNHFFPAAHFHLGEALLRMGYHREAARAFETCVGQAPGVRRAHLYLSDLYRTHLDDAKRANDHLFFALERIRDAAPDQPTPTA